MAMHLIRVFIDILSTSDNDDYLFVVILCVFPNLIRKFSLKPQFMLCYSLVSFKPQYRYKDDDCYYYCWRYAGDKEFEVSPLTKRTVCSV